MTNPGMSRYAFGLFCRIWISFALICGKGATLEDKLYVLRIFGYYLDACELTVIALQMSNKVVARIIREFSNNDGYIFNTAEGDASRRDSFQYTFCQFPPAPQKHK